MTDITTFASQLKATFLGVFDGLISLNWPAAKGNVSFSTVEIADDGG
jgi:hypothetical protein